MGWIEMSVRSTGTLNGKLKKIYAGIFGLASSTLTKDQKTFVAEYNRRAGSKVVEVRRGKVALCNKDDLPETTFFQMPALTEWFAACLGEAYETCDVAARVPAPPSVVAEITKAISGRLTARLEYLSRSGGETKRRTVSAHAVVEVAGRLHVRAYDHDQGRWADFVLSRIKQCVADANSTQRYVDPKRDHEWRSMAEVEVASKVLPPPLGVLTEYGLPSIGRKTVRVRQALLQYVVDDHEASFGPPISKQVRT